MGILCHNGIDRQEIPIELYVWLVWRNRSLEAGRVYARSFLETTPEMSVSRKSPMVPIISFFASHSAHAPFSPH